MAEQIPRGKGNVSGESEKRGGEPRTPQSVDGPLPVGATEQEAINAALENAKRAYVTMGRRLRAAKIDPTTYKGKAWEKVNEQYDAILRRKKRYKSTQRPQVQQRVADQIQNIESGLNNGEREQLYLEALALEKNRKREEQHAHEFRAHEKDEIISDALDHIDAARAAAIQPSGADPDASTVKIPTNEEESDTEAPQYRGHVIGDGQLREVEEGHQIGNVPQTGKGIYAEPEPADEKLQAFRDSEAEEQKEIDKRIAVERAADVTAKPFDLHSVPSVDDSKVRAPQYAPRDMQEGMDALNGEQKTDTLDRGEPQLTDPTGEKTRAPETVPLDTLKKTLQAQLEANPKIKNVNDVDIVEENGSLKLHMDFDVKQGNAAVEGSVVIEGGSPVFKDINATKYPVFGKSAVETAFAGFGAEIQKHFEQQYGQPISNIKVGASGLEIEFKPPTATEPATEPDGRIEPMLDSEPLPVADEEVPDWNWPKGEGTHKELTDKLREAVGKVVAGTKEKVGNAAEVVSEKFTKSKDYLNERAKKLDSQAETSKAEKVVRRMGEIYNKLNWREKLGIGLVLGASAVVTGGASIYLPYAFTGLIGAQRAFGMASMYLSQEKALLSAKVAESGQFISAKERASIDAVLSGALMGAAIGKGIQLANEYELVERTREWLGSMLGHEPAPSSELPKWATAPKGIPDATPVAPAVAEVAPAPPPEVPAAAPAAGEVAAPASVPAEDHVAAASEVAAPAPEVPDISVEATKGHGYEYMMKRLWEQLHDPEKHFTPPQNLDPNSDLARLLDVKPGDEAGINKLVHDLATDNEFYKENGTSVQINLGDTMTVDAKGNIWLGDDILAPAGAPVTPVYHPGAPSALTPETVVSPPPVASGPDVTAAQDLAQQKIDAAANAVAAEHPAPSTAEQPLTWRTGSGGELVDGSGNPVHAGVSESLPGANSFGIVVPEAVPHLYSTPGDEHLLAYGGTSAERTKTIWEYLIRNPEKVVYAADDSGKHRVPWHLVEGKAVAGPPMRTSGLMSLFSPWMKPPEPNDFERIIK